MRSRYLNCLGREIHITEWGDAAAPTVIAWHGLARTGRDFDDFATALCSRWHVVCPDTLGRGLSQWAVDPAREYCLAFYVEQAEAQMRNAVSIGEGSFTVFLQRPMSVFLLVVILSILLLPRLFRFYASRKQLREGMTR